MFFWTFRFFLLIIMIIWPLTANWVIVNTSSYLILTCEVVAVRRALLNRLSSTRSVSAIEWTHRLMVLVAFIHFTWHPLWEFQKCLSLILELLPVVTVNTKVTDISYPLGLDQAKIILFMNSYRGSLLIWLLDEKIFKIEFHSLWGRILYILGWWWHLEHFYLKFNLSKIS